MIYRIALGDTSDQSLRTIARKRQMSPDDLATSYILYGLENARLQGIRYLTACVLTAGIVLLGIWLLSISLPSPSVAPRVLHWTRELVFLFTPWPLTILITVWLLANSSSFGLLYGLLGTLRKVKLFGAEIELDEQSKRRIQIAANEIEAALKDYKGPTDKEIARFVARYQIEQALSKFIDSAEVNAFLVDKEKGFRCTIHIPDPIRYGRLYQLVDYCPTGSGRARDFSVRYGIIGKVWRTEKMRIANDLFQAPSPTQRPHEDEIDEIMSDWGMDRREAESALKHRSYLCFPLIYEDRKVGLFYLDAKEKDSFHDTKEMAVSEKAQKELAPLVAKVLEDSATLFLQLELD